jgi:signal transduction histidine kinase
VLGRLAGGVAHQIRNPLASITNASYVLQRALEQRGDADASKAVAIILEEAWQANRIITDLIDYARVRRPMAKATDVRAVVELAMARHPLPSTVTSRLSLPDHPIPAFIDADQVRDALENLIRNAIEAMPGGGALTLSARVEDGFVVVSVADTGEGVPASVQEKLFEPLVTTKDMGLGLGLTTARALIENQRGTIRWEPPPVSENVPSCPGATFVVRLPVRPRP